MTTELLDRLNRVRFFRRTSFIGGQHQFCSIWFSDWTPFGAFTWTAEDKSGNSYDIEITYTTEPVIITSSTPALPNFDIELFFRPPQVRIIHLSEFVNIGQEIDRPTLVVLADTNVTTSIDGWIDHTVQAYYLIPVQPNISADLKLDYHKRQLKHFKEWMDKAYIFIARLLHRPLYTENDEKRLITGDFYAIEATLNFKEFII